MSHLPPPRAPAQPVDQRFARFVTPDGRNIFIRRELVSAVYDAYDSPQGQAAFVDGQWVHQDSTPTSMIVLPGSMMPVPYTAEQALEVLYGPSDPV